MDVPLSGVIARLRSGNTLLQTTYTDANGIYHFTHLLIGNYSVTYQTPTNYQATYVYPASGAIASSITGISNINISANNLISSGHQFGLTYISSNVPKNQA